MFLYTNLHYNKSGEFKILHLVYVIGNSIKKGGKN